VRTDEVDCGEHRSIARSSVRRTSLAACAGRNWSGRPARRQPRSTRL